MEVTVSSAHSALEDFANGVSSEEEEPDEYAFPLTLKKKGSGPNSPAPLVGGPNGAS